MKKLLITCCILFLYSCGKPSPNLVGSWEGRFDAEVLGEYNSGFATMNIAENGTASLILYSNYGQIKHTGRVDENIFRIKNSTPTKTVKIIENDYTLGFKMALIWKGFSGDVTFNSKVKILGSETVKSSSPIQKDIVQFHADSIESFNTKHKADISIPRFSNTSNPQYVDTLSFLLSLYEAYSELQTWVKEEEIVQLKDKVFKHILSSVNQLDESNRYLILNKAIKVVDDVVPYEQKLIKLLKNRQENRKRNGDIVGLLKVYNELYALTQDSGYLARIKRCEEVSSIPSVEVISTGLTRIPSGKPKESVTIFGEEIDYTFHIQTVEVTNKQYATFLNEAQKDFGIHNDKSKVYGSFRTNDGQVHRDVILSTIYRISSKVYNEEGSYLVRPGYDYHPATGISWYGAMAFCAFYNVRLPTEEEWMKAASHREAYIYPWGASQPTCDAFRQNAAIFADCGVTYPEKVGSLEHSRSYFGLFDAAGNVYEWILNDSQELEAGKVLKGGGFNNTAEEIAVRYKHHDEKASIARANGFRFVVHDHPFDG